MHTYDPIDRFVAAAVAWPDRRALEVGSEKLTYTELDRRSDHLAAQLVAPGAVLSLRRQSYPQFVPTLTPLAIPRRCQAR